MKREISVFDHATEIMNALKKGILITTKNGEKVNSMTISWGSLGIEWGLPVFITYVREGRFTREMLDANPEFTVNIPVGEYDKKITALCGSKSGRNMDKIAELGLTLEEGVEVSVPGIRELPLTLECKVVYRKLQDRSCIPEEICLKHYPQNVESTSPLGNRDFHVAYYGEIVKAYVIE